LQGYPREDCPWVFTERSASKTPLLREKFQRHLLSTKGKKERINPTGALKSFIPLRPHGRIDPPGTQTDSLASWPCDLSHEESQYSTGRRTRMCLKWDIRRPPQKLRSSVSSPDGVANYGEVNSKLGAVDITQSGDTKSQTGVIAKARNQHRINGQIVKDQLTPDIPRCKGSHIYPLAEESCTCARFRALVRASRREK